MRAGPSQLHYLANLYGIRTGYLDMNNQTRQASAESLLAALKALGGSDFQPDGRTCGRQRKTAQTMDGTSGPGNHRAQW